MKLIKHPTRFERTCVLNMTKSQPSTLVSILTKLFEPYQKRVPDVGIITDAMIQSGVIRSQDDIQNDHIAFRSLGIPQLGIQSLEKIFLHHGYTKRDFYNFEHKKLSAYWYSPPSQDLPRIFISELRIHELSEEAQQIIQQYTQKISSDPIDNIDLNNADQVSRYFHQSLWDLPSTEDYIRLLKESEYAAWVIYNRYYLNHYTISIHSLAEGFNTLEHFNSFLENIGIHLNTAGGKIKSSADGLLRQSSTVAKMFSAKFADDKEILIAGSYVEFAERLPLAEFADMNKRELKYAHRRDGFESANADKIFESTYTQQTEKLA